MVKKQFYRKYKGWEKGILYLGFPLALLFFPILLTLWIINKDKKLAKNMILKSIYYYGYAMLFLIGCFLALIITYNMR